MKTFSFRAEGLRDVTEFLLSFRYLKSVTIKTDLEQGFPDVEVELVADCSLTRIDEVLSDLQDSHVMRDTLRECPLVDNPLTR